MSCTRRSMVLLLLSSPAFAAQWTPASAGLTGSILARSLYNLRTAEGSMPRLLFVVLLSIAGFAQTSGQVNVWIPRGPEGGVVGRPIIDPQNPGTLYINAAGSILKTIDAAAHWSGLGAPSVALLAVDPTNSSTLYGTINNTLLLKSTDGGVTWNPSGDSIPTQCAGSPSLVIDPNNPGTLYAGCAAPTLTGGGGIFKSTDGAATWSAASSGLAIDQTPGFPPNIRVSELLIDPQNPDTLYAVSGLALSVGGGVFKSTDGAQSWRPTNSGLTVPDGGVAALAIDPQDSNTLYVSALYGIKSPVFKSVDGGGSWTMVGSGPSRTACCAGEMRNLAVDPQGSGTLYAVSNDGIVKSTDAGANFNLVLPLTDDWGLQWLVVAPGQGGATALYAGGDPRGVLKSSDAGATWATANSGVNASWIDFLAVDPQHPQTLYTAVEGTGLFKSIDGAASWSAAPVFPAVIFSLAIDPRNLGTVYASTGEGIQKSVDGGASWTQQLPADPDGAGLNLAIDLQNPGTLYEYNYAGGMKTADGGASWTNLLPFSSPALSPTAIATDPRNVGTIYAGTSTGKPGADALTYSSGVLKSVDGGRSWSGVNTLWQGAQVSTMIVDPTNSSVLYASIGDLICNFSCVMNSTPGYYSNPNVLNVVGPYKSTDSGSTWVKLGSPAGWGYGSIIGIDQQGTIYARAPVGLVRSQDGGANWSPLPAIGLPSPVHVLAIAIDPQNPNHLFAGTGAGVFEITLVPQD